jgi:hypothetical protein
MAEAADATLPGWVKPGTVPAPPVDATALLERHVDALADRLGSATAPIGIVGLGFVGLPLALAVRRGSTKLGK